MSIDVVVQLSQREGHSICPHIMLEPVKLSLATFQPNKCYAPYLNTPRSLEACRLNGINPVELVEIPYNEFQKDFPNNADAARRRYERINGARIRIYEQVMRDWRKLCEIGWEPPKAARPASAKETIVVVSPSAHCTLLEIQAEKFRKIEQDNWSALQRNLKLELMRADMDVKHKAIVEKHEQIEKANNDVADQRKAERDALYREQLLRQQQEEIEELQDIKKAQQQFQLAAIRRSEEEAENKRKEKIFREQKEEERVQSMKYTQQMRESIMASIENKFDNRKKTCEVRAKSEEARIKEYFDLKNKERDSRKNEVDSKIKQTQSEKDRLANEQREAILSKIRENEKHREHVAKLREEQKKQTAVVNDNAGFEKMQKIKETKENVTREKCERTWQQLKHKEDMAKQELEKVREAQERRKTIKAIRQEAHEIALFRAQKAEEYRREKVVQQLRDKEERANAIKQGFETLDNMRNSMKDIMTRTNLGLKVAMHKLRHKDTFSPDRVISKAIEVSDKVLFPSLERKFGIKDPNEEDPVQKLFKNTGDEGFSFTVGNGSNAFMTTEEVDNEPLYEGDRTATMKGTQDKRTIAKSKNNSDMAPLPIHQLTQNNLKNALLESMKKVEDLNNADPLGRSKSPSRSKSPQASSHRPQAKGEDEDDHGYPASILKLEEEGSAYSSKGTKSKSRSVKTAPNSHSPTTHGNNIIHSSSGKEALSRSDGFKPIQSRGGVKDRSIPKERDDDPNLPMYPFTAGAEFSDEKEKEANARSKSPGRGPKKFDPKKYLKSHQEIRTDVNEKAKFLEPPAGKFRREFSTDHPLAAGGTGKYQKEINKGLKPTGLAVEMPKNRASDVADTLALAEKVEKLTYEATSSVVDGDKSLEALEKELKEKLQDMIDEERIAEEERVETIVRLKDSTEKARLEHIFAEERQRASERIRRATREHDETIKKAMLKTVNLGSAIQ